MAWLLEILLHNEDPIKKDEFKFRKRELSKLKIPSHLSSSKIGSLICGIEKTVSKCIEDILVTVDTNIDEKIFLYPFDEHEVFEPTNYVLNLQELSMKGGTIARALELLIQKLNIWEGVYNRLKYLNKKYHVHLNG